jgi:pyridoxine/pyridoxamine 5'-phosphate oxidase
VDQQQFISFVRQRGLAVIATRGSDGAPEAALVGITATRRGELVFDTSRSSRKYRNLSSYAQVALVIGWDNEMTVQCEGIADIPTGVDRDRFWRPTSLSTRTVWNAPIIRTLCTSGYAQAGCVTAITDPGPLPSRRSL